MKKLTVLLLIACMLFALCCCGPDKPEKDPTADPQPADNELALELTKLLGGSWLNEADRTSFAIFDSKDNIPTFTFGAPNSDFREGGKITKCSVSENKEDWKFTVHLEAVKDTDGASGHDAKDLECTCNTKDITRILLTNYADKGQVETFIFYNYATDLEDWEAGGIGGPASFTVSFDSKGGSACEPIIVTEDEPLPALPVPTKEGCQFLDWKDKNEMPISEGALLACEDITLYAYWKEGFTVSFDSKGGSACDPINVKAGEALPKLPTPTRKQYRFVAWKDSNGKVIAKGALLTTEDITLYASWEKGFTVSFDSNGGSKCSSIFVKENAKLPKLPTPTRDGYKFVAWKDKNEMPIGEGALLTCEDIKLKAYWEPVSSVGN